jgi:ketosteroid isomerase-like protein
MSKNLDALRKGYQDFGKGDIQAVMQAFDPNIEWTLPDSLPFGGTHVGRESVANDVFSKLSEYFDNFSIEPKEFLDAGDRIVVLGEASGTSKRTGKDFRLRLAHVWTIEDGIAKKMVEYADTAVLQEALHV